MSSPSSSDHDPRDQRIAELEQALYTAQEEVALLQNVLDSIPDVIYATDLNGCIRVINTAFSAWVDRPPAAILHKYQRELFPEDLVAYWGQQTETVIATGKLLVTEESVSDGMNTRTYLSQRFPLRNVQGEIYAISGSATDISDRKHAEDALRENQRILRAIIDNAPAVIYLRSPEGRMMIVNQLYSKIIQRPVADILGKDELELFPAEMVERWRARDHDIFTRGESIQFSTTIPMDGTVHDFLTTQFPLYDGDNQPYAVCGIATDVTELRTAERERAELQETIIAAQESALRDLRSPLIPLSDDMLVMPLVGIMDDIRAQYVLETLLTGVATHHATTVIVDITGLLVFDTQGINILLQATQAVRLLGAEVVLTGVNPEIAQTLITLGADLGEMVTPGTLQNGIAYALKRRAKASEAMTRSLANNSSF